MELQIVTCKYCGARLDLTETVGRVVRCKFCYTAHILARSDRAKNFLDQGEHDLDTCRFSDAYTAYEKAAEIDPEEPEAYFGMALATFKVQMLKDEVNNRLQPICHETTEKKFTESKSFLKALALATNEQRDVYEKKGAEIDYILGEFCRLKKSGLDYDCFICAKVTDEDGSHTEDYNRANVIYYYLKDEGYKPFFSERELKGRTGSNYEAFILYALSVSKCMLIVCSEEKYLQTKWVKNEYTRFMAIIANEEKSRDAITFIFSGKPIEKLPSGKKIQGVDYTQFGASVRIREFVKKHVSSAKETPAPAPASKPAPAPAPAPKPVETDAERAERLFQEGKKLYTAKNYDLAAEKYRMAADLGHAGAQNNLGLCYDNGRGVPQSYEEAVKWYRKATEQGNADAQYNLGYCYYYGRGVPQSFEEAVKWYRKAAEQGHARAQNNLGYCYKNGQGVSQNYEEAVKWYRKAAEQGYAGAQNNLGLCYDNGRGVPQSYAEAVKWYRKAAEQGDADAQNNLGVCYYYGQGVSQNYEEAVKWFRKAAERGDSDAQNNLGYCYEYGQGVPQNYEEAVKWYRKAAEQGHADAQNNLGNCYYYGQGVPQSYEEAVKWYRKATEQGNAWAQNNLGNCYYYGQGVPKSREEAVQWYRKAAAQGHANAKAALQRLGYSV